MARILLIDDDSEFSGFLQASLQRNGYQVDCLEAAQGALELLSRQGYDVVLLDNRLPGLSGIEFLVILEQRAISVPVILMTNEPTSDTAIAAMNLGAFDYVVKPLELDDLVRDLEPLIAKAEEIVQLTKEHVRLPMDNVPCDGLQMLGNSRPMQEVYTRIGRVAGSSVPVLILGETGTGKELVARAIHGYSARANRPFVAMNCKALNENLLDDELFGHEPRSYSGAGDKLRKGRFEYAHGGTLFLDEVGDMPLATQIKLLRVLESGEITRVGSNEAIRVDVRVVSATNRDLDKLIDAGEFRQDLLFRLNSVTLRLPALRERGEGDLKLLVEHFLKQAPRRNGRPVPTIQDAAWKMLLEYAWPGNIRELQHVVWHAVLMGRGTQISPGDLELKPCPTGGLACANDAPGDSAANLAKTVKAALASGQANLHQILHDLLDAELLRMTLAEYGGNQVQTARRLGLSRNGLRARMQSLGLE